MWSKSGLTVLDSEVGINNSTLETLNHHMFNTCRFTALWTNSTDGAVILIVVACSIAICNCVMQGVITSNEFCRQAVTLSLLHCIR